MHVLEEGLFNELIDVAADYITTLLNNSNCIAEIDCYLSFAELGT